MSPTDKMSVLQQVLTDARKLATRLRDHDSSADSLLSQAQGMFKQVESMKEVSEGGKKGIAVSPVAISNPSHTTYH